MDGQLAYDASVYYIKWRDIQQNITILPPINYALIVNGEGASGLGTDLALAIAPIRNLRIRAAVSWNDLTIDDDVIAGGDLTGGGGTVLFRSGDRLAGSAKMTSGLSANYHFAIGGGGYVGEFDVSGRRTSALTYRNLRGDGSLRLLPGDPITDVRASFSIESPRWTTTLFGENLNNEKGAAVLASSALNRTQRVRPRTIGLEFAYRLR
jgi:iron complex outermembrane recepter protein